MIDSLEAGAPAANHHLDAFKRGLRELGSVDGENIALVAVFVPVLLVNWAMGERARAGV